VRGFVVVVVVVGGFPGENPRGTAFLFEGIAIPSIAMRVVAAEQRRTRRQILDHSLANVQGYPNKGHPDSAAPHLVLVSAHIIHDHPA